jgi:hypothetical protein
MKHITALFALIVLAASTTPAFADPVGDLTAANAKFATLKSYRTTVVQPDGKTMNGEIVNPDRTHMNAGAFEMITIGDTVYMKMGGAWQKEASSGTSTSTGLPSLQKLYGTLPPAAIVRDLGMKTVDGAALRAYSIQRSPTDNAATMYIGANGLPARVEVPTQRGTMAMKFYDFNAPISIVAPI